MSVPSTADLCEWYAFIVRPRHERHVSESLRTNGYVQFLPVNRVRRVWADRIKTVEFPLFPGYIFCESALKEIRRIISTPGIIDVIRSGNHPLPAQRSEIEDLQIALRNGLRMEASFAAKPIRGERIRIATGPLHGLSGMLVQFRGRAHLVLSVELLNRSILVELPFSSVQPARTSLGITTAQR